MNAIAVLVVVVVVAWVGLNRTPRTPLQWAVTGRPVSVDFAAEYGCFAVDIWRDARRITANFPGKYYIPEVGWSACDVLTHHGQPDRVDRQETALGRSVTWWYHGGDLGVSVTGGTHRISLVHDPAQKDPDNDDLCLWFVDYVDW